MFVWNISSRLPWQQEPYARVPQMKQSLLVSGGWVDEIRINWPEATRTSEAARAVQGVWEVVVASHETGAQVDYVACQLALGALKAAPAGSGDSVSDGVGESEPWFTRWK